MKVLFLTNQLDMGGIEKNLVLLTRSFVGEGHDVIVATRGGSLVTALEGAGGVHHRLSVSFSPSSLWSDAGRLVDLIRSERPDVIHVFSAATASLMTIGRIRGVMSRVRFPPVIASIMGLQNSPDESTFRIYLRAFLSSVGVTRLIVVSPAIDRVVRRLPIARKRFISGNVVGVVIPEDLSRREGSRDSLGLEAGGPLVCTVGRLDPSKSHELFVRAARVVRERIPKARFAIVGNGPERSFLESELVACGLDPASVLLGERDDVSGLLTAADVYVRPGVVEGFVGITVLEAQAVRTAVVSFETDDVKLAIEDGVTGVLVRNGDADALAAAIVELLQDDRRRTAIAAAGRRSVEERFSIEAVSSSLTALYRHEIEVGKRVSKRCVG